MSKQILPRELAKIVTALLVEPESVGELDTLDKYQSFIEDIGRVVAEHCGGVINGVSPPLSGTDGADDEDGHPMLSVSPDHRLPSLLQNVWAEYDREGWAAEIAELDG